MDEGVAHCPAEGWDENFRVGVAVEERRQPTEENTRIGSYARLRVCLSFSQESE